MYVPPLPVSFPCFPPIADPQTTSCLLQGPPAPRGGDRGGADDGYSRRSTRDAYDDRERDRRPRSPSPRRSRSPVRRRSPTPDRERERDVERDAPRERERSRSRSRSRSPRRD